VHTIFYAVLVAPPSLVCAYLLGSTIRGLGGLRKLVAVRADLERWPRLSIVSPACNEERHVEGSIRSILAADYPDLQVVAIDDRSSDRTGEILDSLVREDARVAVEHVRELPAGWLGKLNALRLGAVRADGEWLLFMDADVHLAPAALRQAITEAQRRQLDLLTVVPTIESAGWLSGAIFGVSLAILSAGGRLVRVRDPRSAAVAATGAFILVRRSVFERTPGFEWLKLEVADDFGLCMLIKSHGGRCDIVNGAGVVTLDWYASFREMRVAMQKNMFAILGQFSVARMAVLAAMLLWFGLFPFAALASMPLGWRALPLAGEGALMLAIWLAGRWTGRSRSGALLAPLACLGMCWMTVRAAFVGHRQGGIVWRGVLYPTELLAAHQRVKM